jgi:flagellar L-ring protein precursor FlgH
MTRPATSWALPAALALLAPAAPSIAADLYTPEAYRALASDVKAYRIGDGLTVLVTENTSAVTSADTSAGRATGVGIGFDVQAQGRAHTFDLDGNVKNNFAGNAKTQRAGRLLAQITVNVTGVLPNGDLLVAGEQQLEINDEKQTLRLEGRVRRQDIGEGNTVVSNRIADARIRYVGDGVLSEGQKVSVVTRFLTWLGL